MSGRGIVADCPWLHGLELDRSVDLHSWQQVFVESLLNLLDDECITGVELD